MKKTILAFCLLLLGVLACGSSNTGVAIPTAEGSSATSAPPQQQTFAVGDLVQVQDHTIMLNSATIDSTSLMKASFSLENKGTETLTVSSLLSFEVKDNEGSKLEQDYMSCGRSSFDGSVLPGDKLTWTWSNGTWRLCNPISKMPIRAPVRWAIGIYSAWL